MKYDRKNGACPYFFAEIKNIGEAPTSGRVWAELWVNNALVLPRMRTTAIIPPNGFETISFPWTPVSNTQQVEIRVDPQWGGCPGVNGCETEFNENDNRTDRDLPELNVTGIKVK